jgi:hypothetical protein
MADWARDTPWRQGHILPEAAMAHFQLRNVEAPEDSFCIVVSHDCDLANGIEQEPNLEVIVGRRIAKADGTYTHSKNARRLHLEFQHGKTIVAGELDAAKKVLISKAELARFFPEDSFILDPLGRNILRRWLAARYRRSAFPDEFERRLSDSGLKDRIAKIMAHHGAWVRAIFFDLDGGQELERRTAHELYVLDMYLVYTSEDDPDRALAEATAAAHAIEAAFSSKLNKQKKGWELIELRGCTPISDAAMAIKQANELKEWRLEHLSLRGDPAQPTAD